jgi:hypothetical protein
MDVEVPDTLVTNQSREKYAQMMAEFRGQGMDDDEIKKLITPENFTKYKNIQKPDIVDDFKTSMATDEIARLENIEVPSYQIDEQMEAVKKEADGEDLGDENQLRAKIESTIMRRLVFDFLAEHAEMDVTYEDDSFDDDLMEKLSRESLEREEKEAAEAAAVEDVQGKETSSATEATAQEEESVSTEAASKEEEDKSAAAKLEEAAEEPASPEDEEVTSERYREMDPEERAYNILVDLGMVALTPDPDSPDYDDSQDDEIAS